MNKIEFDEMQQQQRYKIGYQSFMLLSILIMLDNILYGMGIIWIKHPTNTFIILLTSLTFFVSRAIWCDALVGPKDTSKKFSIKIFIITLISVAIAIVVAGYIATKVDFSISVDNGGTFLSVYCLLMWVVIGIIYLTKLKCRKNVNE